MEDYVLLKFGTLKAWNLSNSPEALKALEKWAAEGMASSVLAQEDTPYQKELICEVIDKVNGFIQNDWTGEVYKDREDAKKYVMEYNEEE